MENALFSLKSVITTWQNSSPSWALDIVFGLLCGLLFFLVSAYFWGRGQPLPPPRRHRNSRKRSVEPKRRSRNRKKSGVLKACRECLQELEEARSLISLLGSHLGRPPEQGSLRQFSCQDSSDEVCKAATTVAHLPGEAPMTGGAPLPCEAHLASGDSLPDRSHLPSGAPLPSGSHLPSRSHLPSGAPLPSGSHLPSRSHLPSGAPLPGREPVEDPAPAISPLASLAPLTPCPLPLASSLSAEHQDQSDLKGTPLGTIVQSSPPSNALVPLPNRAIVGVGRSSHAISALTWWQEAARALYLSTSSQCKSQQEHLSHHPPEASLWGDPADRQAEPGSLSVVNPGFQRLLEILLTKRAEPKTWQEKGKEGSLPKPMDPEGHLRSLGSMWKSLGAAQDTTAPQPFWSLRDNQEQLSHIKFLEEHLQRKYSQLFWGLPSLHSESLVATAWVSKSSSCLQPLSVLFNGNSNNFPVPIQLTAPAGLSQAPSLPLPGTQPQPQPLNGNLTQAQPPPLAQIQTQNIRASLSIPPPSSSPHQMGTFEVSYPTAQNKNPPCIPIEIQHLECSWLQKQQQREKALPTVTKGTRDVFSQPTPNIPQNSGVSEGHRSVSDFQRDFTSPNFQKLHLQKRLVDDEGCGGLHFKVQVSLELKQPQGQVPWVCQAQDKQGPLHQSVFANKSSQNPQKMESGCQRKSHGKDQSGKDTSGGLRQCWRKKNPKGLSRDSATFIVKALGISSKKKSERDLKPSKSNPGTCLPRSTDQKHPEKFIKDDLVRKLEQIDQDLDPLSRGQPWLANSHAFFKGNTHTETKNLASSESQEHYVNTSYELPFLNPSTRQTLEEHLLKFQRMQECGLPLQAFEPINLRLHEAQDMCLPQSPLPTLIACAPEKHSKAKFTKALGKPRQAFSEEVITRESGRLPTSSVSANNSIQWSFEQNQKSIKGTPSDSGHGLSEAPLTRAESRLPSQSLTPSLSGKNQKSGTVMDGKKKSLRPNPSSTVARKESKWEKGTQTPEDPCQRPAMLNMNVSSHSFRAEESRKAEEAEKDPAWDIIMGPCVLGKVQTTTTDMKRSGSPGPSQRSSPPAKTVAQDPKEPCLTTKMSNTFELQGKAGPRSQLPGGHARSLLLPNCCSDILLQDYATGMLIQDNVTNVLLQDPHTDVLLAADILASHWTPCGSQRKNTSRDKPAAWEPYNLLWSRQSSQGQQAPRLSKVKAPWKSQRKMSVPTDQREDQRRSKGGQHKEGLAGRRTSQARGMSNPPQVRDKGDIRGRNFLQPLPEEEMAFVESNCTKKMQCLPEEEVVFVECNCTGKRRHCLQDQGPKDPLQKGRPASAIVWSQEPAQSRSCTDTGPLGAQAIMTAVGQILAQKLACHQELLAQEVNQHTKQFQAPGGGLSHRSYPLQSREE